jgi:hypothetical protein
MYVNRQSGRPVGQVTRGKTAPNRLRQTDVYLSIVYPYLISANTGVYVDLGYGAYPITTVETFDRLRRFNSALQVLGVEIDPERVRAGEKYTRPGLAFRLGGFNIPLQAGERIGVIRAFNVLRQYDESQVADALEVLQHHMAESALLLEGTCDPTGRLLAFNLFQKRAGLLSRVAFVFAPRLSALSQDFCPGDLRSVLPKNLIHHAEPGSAIDDFFEAWHKAWQYARRMSSDARQIFVIAALRLSREYGYGLNVRRALLRRAFLELAPTWPLLAS